jgi:hypothetical protein
MKADSYSAGGSDIQAVVIARMKTKTDMLKES